MPDSCLQSCKIIKTGPAGAQKTRCDPPLSIPGAIPRYNKFLLVLILKLKEQISEKPKNLVFVVYFFQ